MDNVVAIGRIVREHDEWYQGRCLNLCAAEGVMSPAARKMLSSYLSNRACGGMIGVRHHGGLRAVDEIDAVVVRTARKLFNTTFVEYQPLSASQANLMAVRVLTEVGDPIMALPLPFLGHDTWREKGASGHRGLKCFDIPVDGVSREINLEAFAVEARTVRPRVVFVGHAAFVFPHPVREMSQIAREIGARIMYDGAHVIGLIAGGHFQDPIGEGADVLTGCTMKTFSGPLGGLILYNDPELDRRIKDTRHGYIAGYNAARMAALAVTLLELEQFGHRYYSQVVTNAQCLGRALEEAGFRVFGRERGYTRSHMVLMDVSEFGGGDPVVEILEQGNVVVTKTGLLKPRDAIRLGVHAVTRYGMKEEEMKEIAGFIRRLLIERDDLEKVGKDVAEFRSAFLDMRFCFEDADL